jgi:cob(I)alamin adenosyltransferase
MKIYTKTGDKGTTRLVDGRECSKSDLRVETYGTVDETNSTLGLVIAQIRCNSEVEKTCQILVDELLVIQNQLFTVGSHLACEKEDVRKHLPEFPERWITDLEKQIDAHTEKLPTLKNFILPGGSLVSSQLHLARTVCRRAERMVVRLIEDIPNPISLSTSAGQDHSLNDADISLRYLNRLSDYLFTIARTANQLLKTADQEWQK